VKNKKQFEKYLYEVPERSQNPVNVWLGFPYTYMYGMSTLGYLGSFKNLDINNDVIVERIFTDSKPELVTAEKVELIGFSMVFETDFTGIFKTLEKYNIPLKSADRKDSHPLVFGGGPVLTSNPEPFADFFDFIIIGDGEEVFDHVIETYKEVKDLKNKEEKLLQLAKTGAVYVPSLYEVKYNDDFTIQSFKPKNSDIPQQISKIHTEELTNCISSPILSSKAFYSDTFFIELGRGCQQKCKFCTASYHNQPARYPSFESVKKAINLGIKHARKLSFIGAMVCEHPDFDKICDYLTQKRNKYEFEIEFSSLKADFVSLSTIKTIKSCNQKSVSIGIEAGNQRLRNLINKNLTDAQIMNTVKTLVNSGITDINIYSMIGLPEEEWPDISDLVELARNLKNLNPELNLNMIISSFIPKPNTPYQWALKANESELQDKFNFLQQEFDKSSINYSFSNPKRDKISAAISRGDRRLATVLEYVYQHNGSLESWNEFDYSGNKIPDLKWFGTRERDFNEILPWEFINIGQTKGMLRHDLKHSLKDYYNAGCC